MRLQAEISVLCIINIICIQHILCDGLSTKYVSSNWTCICSIARQENLNFVPANCSSSCDCSPVTGGPTDNRWKCTCAVDRLPTVVVEDNGSGCFTACNCKSGTITDLQPSRKRISRKVFVIVILLCVIVIALAVIASLLWYVYQKDNHPLLWSSLSPDRQTSYSSATHLISQGVSSSPAYKGYVDSSVKPFIGCIPKKPFLFRSRTGAMHGTIIQFSYSELESTTNRFSDTNLIGVGGSSSVYRGNLRDGRTVAIKRMKIQEGPDAEHIFMAEIELISRLHHCHVVPLLGYCSEHLGKNAERLLVFEYIPNGNLRECLDGDLGQLLDWNTRVAIALGAARGLEYLHEAAAPRILHRDVKSSNILLDEKWRAMITDLGMAKHLHNDGILSCPSSPARMQGTFGYFAPEYAIIGRASLKSDVFSFGVVLLELITGRMPIHKSPDKGEESLVIWATPRLHDSKRVILELPDPRLKGIFEEEEMQVMAYLAKECLLLDPDSRPSMGEVVQILSTIRPKSRRKDLPLHNFQCTDGSRSGHLSTCDRELSETSEIEEIKKITSEMLARCTSLSNSSSDFCIPKTEKEANNPCNDTEKLMPPDSTSRSWRLEDDEVVDLTEPRFESFCLPSINPHVYS